MVDYSKLPEHCQKGMRLYVEDGVLPGGFLQAVVSNKLVESFGLADSVNVRKLFSYADFLYNEAPLGCWGSEENMLSWIEKKRKK